MVTSHWLLVPYVTHAVIEGAQGSLRRAGWQVGRKGGC